MPDEKVTAIGVLEEAANKKERSPEEREYTRLAVAKHRREKKQDDSSRRWNCTDEITEKTAREILIEVRGITNDRALEVILELADVARNQKKLYYNRFLFTHGVRLAIQAQKEKTGSVVIPEIEDGEVRGELLSRRELYAIWDYSMFRMPEITFEEFLRLRRVAKTDAFLLGRDILKKDFHEHPHGVWRDFFPKFNPDGLKPGYTQEDLKAWLAAQDPTKNFSLVASRNSYKSSFAIVWMVSAICACPDLKILLCTETKPLSRGFLRGLRSYFEIRNINSPTLFQTLLAEMCILPDDGSALTFESPMASLGLIEATAEATSMDSAAAGRRTMVLHLDDPISNITTGNEEMRQASIDKYDLLTKLVEPGGYITMCSTPWHPEDLTATLIKRSNEDEEHPLQYRIDPAWVVKPEAAKKDLLDLKEDDIESLLFPTRLTFKFLMKELKANPVFFRSQNLCEFIDPDGDNAPKVHFDEITLRAAHIPKDSAPRDGAGAFTVICCDLALTSNRTSDYSAMAAIRISPTASGNWRMTVLDIEYGRFKMSELALKLVLFRRKFPECRSMFIERISGTELLQREVNMLALRYEISMQGVFWSTPDLSRDAKQNRLLGLSILLENSELKFCNGPFSDELIAQFCRVSTFRRNAQGTIRFKGIDIADAISMGQRYLPSAPLNPEQQKDREAEETRERMLKQHAAMFGGDFAPPPQPQQQQEPELSQAQKNRNMLGRILPPGMRY
jgi:hypothetical protein